MAFIFLLGWPFEWPAIVLIFLPLLAPVAKGLDYDMVWFACVVAVVLQTAFLLIFPSIAMWFPNWLQERAEAECLREQSVVPVKPVPNSRAADKS